MAEPFFHAFSVEYPLLTNELYTEVWGINPYDEQYKNVIKRMAIWDTGATISAITPELKKELGLIAIDSTEISGVNSNEKSDIVLISLRLPNEIIIPEVMVAVCDLNSPGIDVLIGMDIMRLGDFAIANGKGKTLFSFSMPSLPLKINMLNQADHINKENGYL